MNFFETSTGNGCCGVFVERTEMTSEFKLFMDVDILIAEDWRLQKGLDRITMKHLYQRKLTNCTTLGNKKSTKHE